MRLVDKLFKQPKKILTSYTEEDLKYFRYRTYKNLINFTTIARKHNVVTYLLYIIKDVSFLIPNARTQGTINRKKTLK